MNFSMDTAVAEAAHKHRERVEDWIRLHLKVAEIPEADLEAIKTRLHLIQKDGTLVLLIDGTPVGTMKDVVSV